MKSNKHLQKNKLQETRQFVLKIHPSDGTPPVGFCIFLVAFVSRNASSGQKKACSW